MASGVELAVAGVAAGSAVMVLGAAGRARGAGRVAKLVFSQPHGFQEKPFELVISSQTPGAVVRYTTDGSVPTEGSGQVLNLSLIHI